MADLNTSSSALSVVRELFKLQAATLRTLFFPTTSGALLCPTSAFRIILIFVDPS